jgi:prepilin-type N-terminal cleavage/methylation domain-containing protein
MNQKGFTLVELMTALVIVGVLSIAAVPVYRYYMVTAKTAEAYQNLGVLEKGQVAYFYENKEFRTVEMNPYVAGGAIHSNVSWRDIGTPIGVGSTTTFSYLGIAGKTDASGTHTNRGGVNEPRPLMSWGDIGGGIRPGGIGRHCAQMVPVGQIIWPEGFKPSHDWSVMWAVANFHDANRVAGGDIYAAYQPPNPEMESCTIVVKSVAHSQAGGIVSRPFLVLKEDLSQPVQEPSAGDGTTGGGSGGGDFGSYPGDGKESSDKGEKGEEGKESSDGKEDKGDDSEKDKCIKACDGNPRCEARC